MSGLGDVPVYVQPLLQMKATTAAMIAEGSAYQIGGVVREVGTSRLVELLKEAPRMQEGVQNTAANAVEVSSTLRLSKIDLSTVNLKTAGKLGGVILVGGAALGGYIWVRRQMKAGGARPAGTPVDDLSDDPVAEPACLTSFRASLMAYVEAGSKGRLTTQIVDKLANDLRDVEQLPTQDAVTFTLDELLPLLELVIAHTPILAQAFDVELDEEILESEGVHSLHRHLEAQMAILAKAA